MALIKVSPSWTGFWFLLPNQACSFSAPAGDPQTHGRGPDASPCLERGTRHIHRWLPVLASDLPSSCPPPWYPPNTFPIMRLSQARSTQGELQPPRWRLCSFLGGRRGGGEEVGGSGVQGSGEKRRGALGAVRAQGSVESVLRTKPVESLESPQSLSVK